MTNTKKEKTEEMVTIPALAIEMLKTAKFIEVFRGFAASLTHEDAYEKTESFYIAYFKDRRYKNFESFKRAMNYHINKNLNKTK